MDTLATGTQSEGTAVVTLNAAELTTREMARDKSYSNKRSRLGSRNGKACFSSNKLTASPR